jgi:hypothetical protein
MKSRFLLDRVGDCRFLALDSKVLIHQIKRHHPMPTKDDFAPDHTLPLFLSESADEPEQPVVGTDWDLAVIWSRMLKTSILIVTATAIGIAFLSVENPVTLYATIMASLVDKLALQPGNDQPTPIVRTIASTQDLPPIARDEPPESAPPLDKTALRPPTSPSATDAPARNEAALEPAVRSQTEISQPSADALFEQYQAWRAKRAQVRPAQDAQPRGQPMIKQRHARIEQNARAEIRPVQNIRREQNAQVQDSSVHGASVQVPSVQGAPAQEGPSVQNAQAPSFLQIFGKRD